MFCVISLVLPSSFILTTLHNISSVTFDVNVAVKENTEPTEPNPDTPSGDNTGE